MPELEIPNPGEIETLGLIFTLSPGLICLFIIHSLTSRERKIEPVPVILHSLAYTLIVHAVWELLQFKSCIPTKPIVGLPLTAVVVGLVLAAAVCNGWIYKALRFLKITDESEWESVWKTAFKDGRKIGEYVIITFEDGKQVQAAIRDFSSTQADGHITIERFRWIGEDYIPGEENTGILVFSASSVRDIHFQATFRSEPTLNAEQQTRSASAINT